MAGHDGVCFLTWPPVAPYRTVLVGYLLSSIGGRGSGAAWSVDNEPCHSRHSWLLRGAVRQEAFSPASCRLWAGQRACLIVFLEISLLLFPSCTYSGCTGSPRWPHCRALALATPPKSYPPHVTSHSLSLGCGGPASLHAPPRRVVRRLAGWGG